MAMHGTVKWFDPRKGFGFITGDDRMDYFVHQSNIVMEGFRKLREKNEVTFDAGVDDQGRSTAVNVIPVTSGNDAEQ